MPSSPMSRPPSPNTVVSIQILRGFAALLVVVHHTFLQLSYRTSLDPFQLGAIGVDIFFVISGFVIFLTVRKLSWHEFFRRRLVRVVPLYWVFLTLKTILLLLLPGRFGFSPQFVVASYLFVPAYRGGDPSPLITAAWTLNYEMYFYICFTAILACAPRHLLRYVILLVGVLSLGGPLLISILAPTSLPAPLTLFHPICLEFLAGLILAWLWLRGVTAPLLTGFGSIALAVVWALMAPEPAMFALTRPLLWGIPAVLLVCGFLIIERAQLVPRWAPLLLLGDASYSLYLSHTAVLPLVDRALIRFSVSLPPLAAGAIMLATCVIVGVLCYRFVEIPALRAATRLVRLKARVPATESGKPIGIAA